MGEATDEFLLLFGDEDISIHASRGGSDKIGRNWVIDSDISIHASRGGSDDFSFVVFPYSPVISIHASRGGSDPLKRRRISILQTISIHASRGGSDYSIAEGPKERFDFNPRFPWGKRRWNPAFSFIASAFQSTLPVGEATMYENFGGSGDKISIHASRGGSDAEDSGSVSGTRVFQSTLPVGEATQTACLSPTTALFQSTLPVGEATISRLFAILRSKISIHASRGGSDLMLQQP